MSSSTFLLLIGMILIIGIFVCFPKARVLLKGFIGKFIEDQAKTPEGARAIYQQAIEEAEDKYRQANDVFQRLTGKLTSNVNKRKELDKKLKEVEKKCENAANQDHWDDVELYAQEREGILEELEILIPIIEELTVNVQEAKEINTAKEQELLKLRKEQSTVVNSLAMNKQLKEIYDDMDELKSTSATSKMVNSVREGSKAMREEAVGARAVHNNKTSTKLAQADARNRQTQTLSYVEELKRKKAAQSKK